MDSYPKPLNWISKILIGIAVVCYLMLVWFIVTYKPQVGTVKVIDCSLAEISPDFTPKMREECRKARSGRI
jgi:hypothetical protein